MTLRVVLAAFIGAVLAFAWGFFSWGMSDLWSFGFKPVPNEAPLLAVLEPAGLTESNAYYFPQRPLDTSDQAAMDAWKARHRSGAVGMVLVHPSGIEPMPPIVLVRGFVIEFLGALMLAILIGTAGGASVIGRAAMLFVAVAFVSLASHGVLWNFLSWPTPWGRVMVIDTAITWLLAGLPAVALLRRTVKPA